jgi:hypothetical protein
MPTNHPPWVKGMVMAQEHYALLTPMPFHLPNNPGSATIYVRPVMARQPVDATLLKTTEQASINTRFARAKHYYLSIWKIERACFTALDPSINDAFKVSNDPRIQGWHAGMHVINILGQLSTIYGQPSPAVLEMNDAVFCSPYLAADAPEVLFCRIEECSETALLGRNPYADWQLTTNAIRLLLTTKLYIWHFKEWDSLMAPNQAWIALRTMIKEAFQSSQLCPSNAASTKCFWYFGLDNCQLG